MTREGSAFEIEAASGEEFLRLLTGRERAEVPSQNPRSVARAAVFVTPLQDVTGGRYAFPKVTRRVVAAFSYGPGIVSYGRTTSSVVELPEVSRELVERQREACEELRAEIERGVREANLAVPVHEGHLRRPNHPRQER